MKDNEITMDLPSLESGVREIALNPLPPQLGYVYVGVAVAMWDDRYSESRVLLGRRKGSHRAGSWGMPGGGLDFGESLEGCVSREVFEETGMTVVGTPIRTACITEDIFPAGEGHNGKHYVTFYYEVISWRGEAKVMEPDKCTEWKWFTLDSVPTGDDLMSGTSEYFARYRARLTERKQAERRG